MNGRWTWIIITFIILLGFLVRTYQVTTSPEGLYIDETSIGYNAYSLLKTGRDEHGKAWPVFFEAFGEYKLPVYVYSVYLTQLVLGPIDLSVRLPAVIFGALTIPALFGLVYELGKRVKDNAFKITPYLSAFLLAISPWHFQFTHAGFEASSAIFFLTLGSWLLLLGLRKRNLIKLILAAVSFTATFYAYNSARIVTPVVILGLLLTFKKEIQIKQTMVFLSLFIFLSLPFAKFALSPAGLARAQQVTIFYNKDDQKPWVTFVTNLWRNIAPETLFLQGEPTIAHLTSHRMSLLYPIELPFLVIGIIYLFRKKIWGILLWLIIGFVPPAITTLNPHALRASLVIPATVMTSALGFGVMLSRIRRVGLIRSGIGIYVAILLALGLRFLTIYHTQYAVDAGWDWQVGIKRASVVLKKLEPDYSRIYITEAGAGKIAYWWYLKIDPRLLWQTPERFAAGKYIFGSEPINHAGKTLYVTSNQVSKAKLLHEIDYPNGAQALNIYQLDGETR